MTRDRFARIRELVLEAGELPAETRRDHLTRKCPDDPDMVEEVLSLLALEGQEATIAMTGGIDALLGGNSGREFLADLPPLEKKNASGDIDRYVLKGELGVGGMGMVYLAEQTDPIRREVALKLVRSGRRADRIVARFEAERSTLALMDHPNIAKVLDAGTARDGCPFFVMELVPGAPLDEFCRDRGMELRHRLDLLLPICSAVQHAHQKGIIHRDLKPTNILVYEQDGAPAPKVIDFGIAKVMTDSADTGMTQEGQAVGTLNYMSPEQARGELAAVDTRTDVYALGVVAYQLITGRLPYDMETGSLARHLKVICEESPRPFAAAVPGMKFDSDLETVVMKALAKDPADRYQSVSALAGDLKRFLSNQPILARPPSAVYLLSKLIVRNKLPATLIFGLLVALVGFGIGMSLLFSRSEANLKRALMAESEAGQTASLLTRMFEINDPGEARGNSITAREILDRGAESLTTSDDVAPAVRARFLYTLGMVFRGLGLYERSLELLNAALMNRNLVEGHPREEIDSDIFNGLGRVHRLTGNLAAADSFYMESLALKVPLFGPDSPKVAATLSNLAMVRLDRGQPESAKALFEEADRIFQAGPRQSLEYSANLNNLGLWHNQEGRYAEADSYLTESLDIRKSILDPNHFELATAYNNLAAVRQNMGRTEEAVELAEHALAIWKEVLGPQHPDLATVMLNLAVMERDLGHFEKSEVLLQQALAIQEVSLGTDHFDVSVTLNSLGRLYVKMERYTEAREALMRALAIKETQLGPDHAQVSTTLNSLGELALSQGDLAAAEPQLTRARAIRLTVYGADNPRTSLPVHNLGLLRLQQGRLIEADDLFTEALRVRSATLGPDHVRIAQSLEASASVARARGRPARADSLDGLAQDMFERLGY